MNQLENHNVHICLSYFTTNFSQNSASHDLFVQLLHRTKLTKKCVSASFFIHRRKAARSAVGMGNCRGLMQQCARTFGAELKGVLQIRKSLQFESEWLHRMMFLKILIFHSLTLVAWARRPASFRVGKLDIG